MNLRPKFGNENFDESIISAYGKGVMYEKFKNYLA